MYAYQVHLVNLRCLYETLLRLGRLTVYTYPIRLVNSRYVHETVPNVEAIARVCLSTRLVTRAVYTRTL